MRHKNRFAVTTAAVAAAAVAISLTGCTNSGGGGDEVNLLLIETDASKELRDVYIPEFTEETGIKVNVDLVPESGMDAKLSLSLGSASSQYDVVQAGAKNLSTLVAAEWIQPLDNYIGDSKATDSAYLDGFPDDLRKSLELDGSTYTMPYQVGADLLYYNKSMFEEAGLDPASPPTSMEEIVEAAEKLTIPEQDQAGFVGRGSRSGNENSFTWLMMWFLNGGRWADSGGEPKYDVLTDPASVKTTEQYKQLLGDYAPSGTANYTYLEAQAAMLQGKAAMWLDAAQLGPALEDESQSSVAGDVGYVAPTGEGDDYIVGAVWGFSMAANIENTDASWKLIQFLTSKDVAVGQAVSGLNGSPARVDALKDDKVREAYNPEYLDAMSDAIAFANPNYSPLIPQGTEIRGAVSLALSKVLGDQAGVDAALKEANDTVKQLIE